MTPPSSRQPREPGTVPTLQKCTLCDDLEDPRWGLHVREGNMVTRYPLCVGCSPEPGNSADIAEVSDVIRTKVRLARQQATTLARVEVAADEHDAKAEPGTVPDPFDAVIDPVPEGRARFAREQATTLPRVEVAAPYRIATDEEAEGYSDNYHVLMGPNGVLAVLGENEDRSWWRDGKPVVEELNRLAAELRATYARGVADGRAMEREDDTERQALGIGGE